jgi:hypothetical protein
MTKSEVFALVAGIVGLVVDFAAMVALLSGAISLPSTSFLGSSPFSLAIVTFFPIVYSMLLVLYFARVYWRKRWEIQKWATTDAAEKSACQTLSYLLFVPAYLLWAAVMWTSAQAAEYPPLLGVPFVFFSLFVLGAGGSLLAEIVDEFDLVLNPAFRARRMRV